jgi:hypothetical protein
MNANTLCHFARMHVKHYLFLRARLPNKAPAAFQDCHLDSWAAGQAHAHLEAAKNFGACYNLMRKDGAR